MEWVPRYSVGLYHHLGQIDGPSIDQIDRAFRDLDEIPDLAGVEFFSGTCVTLDNAHLVKQRLNDRGLECSMVHHGEPYIRGSFPWSAFTSSEAVTRREAIGMCLDALEVARALGGLGIYVFTPMDGGDYPFQQDFRASREYTLDALREICEAAGDLKVALEFRPYLPRGWAAVGSMSKTLEIIGELGLPNLGAQLEVSHALMSGENLAQAAWEAARRDLLYHVHLNDTQLPQDLSTIFGSHHMWEAMEMLHWLRDASYQFYLGLDVVWTREEPVRSAQQFISNTNYLLRVLDAIDSDAMADAMRRNDILDTQALVWQALRVTG